MARARVHLLVVIVALVTIAGALVASADGQHKAGDWLRGSGKDLEICLRGEVLDANGQPATDVDVVGGLNATGDSRTLEPVVNGHRFEVSIPVNRSRWYSFWLRAGSKGSDHVAYNVWSAEKLRQLAEDDVKLKLQAPRHVKVKVIDHGIPVAGAHVRAEVGAGIERLANTGRDGVAELAALAEPEFFNLTAWTNDHRIGGFSFDRTPARDPKASEQAVELNKCRDQKIRFVSEDGSPVPYIKFNLQIATPDPDYNFIGSNEHLHLTTDSKGEAVCRRFPDWEKVYFYAEIKERPWVIEGEPKFTDGVAVIKLKPSKPRQRVDGRVVSNVRDVDPSGLHVWFRSFQGEREDYSDVVSVFCNRDGTFSIDVLPDATYCACVLDSRWVGNIVVTTPYASATKNVVTPELAIFEGQPVEVQVTKGPEKKPYANLGINLQREYDYFWIEKGERQNGRGGPQWFVTTDENGIARTRTLPGTLRASVYTPTWHDEQKIEVKEGQPAKIALHREIDEKRTEFNAR